MRDKLKRLSFILIGLILLVWIVFFGIKKFIKTDQNISDEYKEAEVEITAAAKERNVWGALDAVDAYLEDDSNNSEMQARKATMFLDIAEDDPRSREEYLDHAQGLLRKSLKDNPTGVQALYAQGYMHELKGEYADALAIYSKALDQDKKNTAVLAQIGHVYEMMGKTTEALTFYGEAFAVKDTYIPAHLGVARIYWRDGDVSMASLHFLAVLATADEKAHIAEASYSIGMISLDLEDYGGALVNLTKATELVPTYARAHAAKGLTKLSAYALLKKQGKAVKDESVESAFYDVDYAISLDPSQTFGYVTKAKMLLSVDAQNDVIAQNFRDALNLIQNDTTLPRDQKDSRMGEMEEELRKYEGG